MMNGALCVLAALPTLPAWAGWAGLGASVALGIGLAVSLCKNKKPGGASEYLKELNRQENWCCVVIRREDVMPLWLSSGAEKFLGLTLKQLREDVVRLGSDFPGEKLWEFYRNWNGAPNTAGLFTRADGKVVQLQLHRSEDGTRDFLIFLDETDLAKRMESLEKQINRLEEQSQSRTGFFSRMSHEIRTPMNGIVGMLTIAEGKLPADSPAMEYLKRADQLSDHMLSLLNDILDISRMEANKVELESKPLSLRNLGALLLEMYQKPLEAKGVAYTVEFEDMTVDTVLGDEMRLRQIIINLLSNAVKFTASGSITLTFRQMMLRDEKVDLAIRVQDTGVGMSKDFLNKIFRPFEQESIETSHRYGGTGLGMAITENLVHLMDGQIVVESTPGKGSEFTVFLTLPVAEGKVVTREEKQPEQDYEDAFRNRRILLAEDNETNAMIAQEILEEMGAQVEVAQDGQIAVEKFSAHPDGYYDFILMDVQMPRMDGRSAAREIRKRGGKVPIFALSADAFVEDQRLSAQSGMNGHFAKPVNYTLLRKEIGAFLKERENRL